MPEDCHGCIGEIKAHRDNYLTTIKEARQIAKETNQTVIIYRATDGSITLAATGTIERYITPYL